MRHRDAEGARRSPRLQGRLRSAAASRLARHAISRLLPKQRHCVALKVTTAMLRSPADLQALCASGPVVKGIDDLTCGEHARFRKRRSWACSVFIARHVGRRMPIKNERASVTAALERPAATGADQVYAATPHSAQAWVERRRGRRGPRDARRSPGAYDGADAQRGLANTARCFQPRT